MINFFNCYPCKCEFSLYRCYECDDEVLADKFKKVSECMEHLKKLACVPTLDLALGKFKKVSEYMEHLKKLACVPTLDLALGKFKKVSE